MNYSLGTKKNCHQIRKFHRIFTIVRNFSAILNEVWHFRIHLWNSDKFSSKYISKIAVVMSKLRKFEWIEFSLPARGAWLDLRPRQYQYCTNVTRTRLALFFRIIVFLFFLDENYQIKKASSFGFNKKRNKKKNERGGMTFSGCVPKKERTSRWRRPLLAWIVI